MIYVYAFCPCPTATLTMPTGIAHASVQLVTADGLGAIVEADLDVSLLKDNDQQLMEAVLVHDYVLGQLFSQISLLPLRFGTQFTDIEALQDYLHTHQQHYLQRLEALADKAEYLVKLLPKPPELPDPGPAVKGRDYFLAKKRRVQAQSRFQAQQNAELQHLLTHLETSGITFVHRSAQAGEERLHLLSAREVTLAQTQLADWQQLAPSWDMQCSDPLPPYHFAT